MANRLLVTLAFLFLASTTQAQPVGPGPAPALPLTGGALSGLLTTAPPVAGGAGLNLPPGVAPSSPNNGDLWTTSAGIYALINGSTIGPLGSGVSTFSAGSTGLSPNSPTSGAITLGGTLATGYGGTGQTTFTSNLPLIGAGTGAVAQGSRSGNTTDFATVGGTLVSGDCVSIDANLNLVDAGGACTTGGGGGTVNSAAAGQIAYYGSTGTVVSGNSNVRISAGALSLGIASSVQGSLILANISNAGLTTLATANTSANSYTLTLPAITDTLVTLTATQTLTNKSIAGSEINSGAILAAYLPTATTNALGIMEVSTGLSVNSGVVTVTNPSPGSSTSGDLVTFSNSSGALQDSGILASSLAPKVSPSLSNVVVTGAFTATGLVTNADLANPATTVNGTTCTLGSTCTVTESVSGITLANTTITGGNNGSVEYNNNGVFGEYAITGSGAVVLSNGPTIGGTAVFSGTATFNGVFQIGGQTMTFPVSAATLLYSGGPLGTPGSLTLTNATGLPIAGITGVGTGVAIALADAINTNGGVPTASTASVAAGAIVLGAGSASALTGLADVAAGQVLTSGGVGSNPAYSATPTLGASGTLGSLTFGNATSGTVKLQTVTGALGAVIAQLPANSGIIAELDYAQTWSAAQTFTNADLILAGSSSGAMTLEAPAAASTYIATFPANSGVVAETNVIQTFSAAQTLSGTVAVTGALVSSITSGMLGIAGSSANPSYATYNTGVIFLSSANGITLGGDGQTNDLALQNKNNTIVCSILDNTTNFSCPGTGFNGAIGATTPSTAAFTTLSASTSITDSALSTQGVVCNSAAGLFSTSTTGCANTVQSGPLGGTGLSTAAIGDIMYASATTPTWSRLADVAVGQLLASGGANTAPAWAANAVITGFFSTTGTTLPTQGAGTLGIGGEATTPTTSANGEGDVFLTSTTGGITLQGKGSVSDVRLNDSAGAAALTVPTGTTNLLGAGTLTGLTGLTSSGTITFSGVTTGTNADFVCMATGGTLTLQTSACTISSKRFKNQAGYVNDNQALTEVLALRPAIFSMRDGATPNPDPNFDRMQIGLYAEDVAEVDVRASIFENDLRTVKSYRQESIIAITVGAVKAEQSEIDELRAENDNLHRDVERLKAKRY